MCYFCRSASQLTSWPTLPLENLMKCSMVSVILNCSVLGEHSKTFKKILHWAQTVMYSFLFSVMWAHTLSLTADHMCELQDYYLQLKLHSQNISQTCTSSANRFDFWHYLQTTWRKVLFIFYWFAQKVKRKIYMRWCLGRHGGAVWCLFIYFCSPFTMHCSLAV